MARAVITLAEDISPWLPILSQRIEGCAYNPETSQAAFHRDNMVVVMYPREINIYKIENEAVARNIMDWLKKNLDNEDEMPNEVN
jgi:hypothetical protein